MAIPIPNLANVRGTLTIGTGQPGSIGHINASDYQGVDKAVNAAVYALASAGGGVIEILPGQYYTESHWSQDRGQTLVRLLPGCRITPRHSGAIGVARLSGASTTGYDADGSSIGGRGKILMDRFYPGQVAISIEDLVDPELADLTFECTTDEARLLTTSMRFFDILRCSQPTVQRPKFLPNWGIQLAKIEHGNGLQWTGGHASSRTFQGLGGAITSQVPERGWNGLIEYPEGRPMKAGIELAGMEWFRLTDFRAFALGDATGNVATCKRIVLTGTSFSWATADQSINDSGNGFGDVQVGDAFITSGFSNAANNGYWRVNTKSSNGKLIVEKATGAVMVNESAGASATLTFVNRPDYIVRLQRLFPPTASEQGHMLLDHCLFEMTAAKKIVDIWGVNNANIENNVIGYAANGPAFTKEGGIVVSGSDGTVSGFEASAIHMRDNDIHNVPAGDKASGVFVERCQLADVDGGSFEVNSFGYAVRIASGSVRRSTTCNAKFSTLLPTGSTLTHPILLEAGTIPDGAAADGYLVADNKWQGYATGVVNNLATGDVITANNNKIGG